MKKTKILSAITLFSLIVCMLISTTAFAVEFDWRGTPIFNPDAQSTGRTGGSYTVFDNSVLSSSESTVEVGDIVTFTWTQQSPTPDRLQYYPDETMQDFLIDIPSGFSFVSLQLSDDLGHTGKLVQRKSTNLELAGAGTPALSEIEYNPADFNRQHYISNSESYCWRPSGKNFDRINFRASDLWDGHTYTLVFKLKAKKTGTFNLQFKEEENLAYSNSISISNIQPITITPSTKPEPVEEDKDVPIYRLYNKKTKEHLYTPNIKEYNVLPSHGWTQEGIGWTAPDKGKAVYRLYNPKTKDHHYTCSANEAKVLTTKHGWVYDNRGKALFYSDGNKPVYRLYNKKLKVGSHHFTTSANEYKVLPSHGWKQEGVAFYAK